MRAPGRRRRRSPRRPSGPAAGHQQADLVDVGRRRPRTSPTIRPSYMTTIRSDRARISSRSSRDEQDRGARRAPLEQHPMDRLDGADVEAAGRLDGDHQARARRRSRGRRSAAGGCRPTAGGPGCRSTARAIAYSSLRPWASARAAASSMNQPRATGGVAVALHDQVVGDRQVRRAADPGPVLRDMRDARAGWPWPAGRLATSSPSTVTLPRHGAQAGDDLGQLALAVARDRGDARRSRPPAPRARRPRSAGSPRSLSARHVARPPGPPRPAA